MSLLTNILSFLPQVKTPEQKNRPFKEKLKWTLIILVAFFILSVIPLYGLGENGLARFEQLSIILGASFGSIMSLGIGPIVTASIVLQLLSGSGILKLDLTTKIEDDLAYVSYQVFTEEKIKLVYWIFCDSYFDFLILK